MRALSSAAVSSAGKRVARLRFEVGGEAVAAPGFAHRGLRAGLIADGEERARERKSPLGAVRRLAAEKGDDRARIGALLPQRRFGMPPQVTTLGQLGLAARNAA